MTTRNQGSRLADYRTSAYVRGQMGQVSAFSGKKPFYPADEKKPAGPSFFSKIKSSLVTWIGGSTTSPKETAA